MEDAKSFLRQVEKLDVLIANKLIEQQQWRDIALGITANMSGERVQSSGTQSKMADAITKCVDMETEINALIDRLIDTRDSVTRAIETLDSATEYNVLHMKYIQLKSLSEIAESYGKDYSWATTVHGRAIASLQKILDTKAETEKKIKALEKENERIYGEISFNESFINAFESYEHDGDCCNAGAEQYMCKCKMPCDTALALTNGDIIRRMTDADLAEFIIDGSPGNEFFVDDNRCFSEVELLLWLEQLAK